MYHSNIQLVLLLRVYSNWCLYNELIFLIYLTSLQVLIHSLEQLILLYQVYSDWCLYNELIFLIWLHSLQVGIHSLKQLISLLRVYSNWCLINELIFLNYLHSLQVIIHSIQQLVWLYQVYSNSFFLSSTDVPFTNGQFTRGVYTGSDCSICEPAFSSLLCSGITSDSGLFLLIHFIHSLYKPI